ncbi:hypothetical protein NM208_g777 [Fusarium decemcellulare]|uniref:Uncharacterized protein n=1 Tax=Fusarium decemcellulare TaxID=57161 RepID=A0ACC1SYC7_9HYPO|nr:hypothetical protein NM208_g777 [Fusarium decemcellulare]
MSLTDPVFQDLHYTTRFFIDYFSKRVCHLLVLRDSTENPYRAMIALAGLFPFVPHAITAIASCHLMHSVTGSTITSAESSHLSAPTDQSSLVSIPDSIQKHYIMSKHQCLGLLSTTINDPVRRKDYSTLATVTLLTILDLFEKGSGSWTVHIEGAKMLLGQHQTTYNLAQQSGFRRLVGDIAMFEVLGSTLCRPGALASSPRWQFLLAMLEDCYIVGVGCPKEILLSIGSFAMQRRGDSTPSATSGNLERGSLQETLRRLRSFDVQAWATTPVNQRHSEPSASTDDLLHVGHIWKLTAEIYGFHVLSTLKQSVTDLQPPTLSSVIEEFGSLERNDEELLKCLVWPAFVVGAASTHWCQRQWAYQMCNKIWEVTWSANAMNAKLVLADLWDKQDLKSSGNVADADGWDWITELSKLDDFWLFA